MRGQEEKIGRGKEGEGEEKKRNNAGGSNRKKKN